jgi:release factor glutamine methyltransferase
VATAAVTAEVTAASKAATVAEDTNPISRENKSARQLTSAFVSCLPAGRYGSFIFMTKDEEPVAYTLGWQPFLGLKIFLDSKPLIPRPETEWWTELLLKQIGSGNLEVSRSATARGPAIFQQKNTRPPNSADDLKFLDLCAGSGAIGCAALKMLPDAEIYFGEIDPSHETTILKNIRENNLDAKRAHIYIGDLFEPFGNIKFDVIAANPPYVPENRELPSSVADFEPALALRAGPDGLDSIRRIAKELKNHLAKDGVAWIECDSVHAEFARSLFLAEDFSAYIKNDQYGVPRIIVARHAFAGYNSPNV